MWSPLARLPPSRRRDAVLVGAAALAVVAVCFAAARALAPVLSDPEALRASLAGYGPLAPAAFALLVAVQVVVAPVPGQALAFVGGYLFGPLAGTAYALAGAATGTAVAMALSRHLGRPFVERVVPAEHLARFDAFTRRRGVVALFLVFLVPGLPDDAVCFVAGLSEVDLAAGVGASILGRAPGYYLVCLAGAGVATADWTLAVGVLTALVVVTALGYLVRERIFAALGLTRGE